MKTGKILVIVTNHSLYPNRTDTTGLWVTELTHFYDIMNEAGFEMDFASPLGGKTPLDERSQSWMYMDAAAKGHLKDRYFMDKINNTKSASEVNSAEYFAIYFTGGHGTMWDFRTSPDLKKVAEQIYNQGGYVTSVCHGAAGLLSLTRPDGKPLIAGKKVTGFSNTEEWLAGLKNEVPFLLQDELKTLGAKYQKSFFPFSSYAVVDGRLVTGQNPNSGKAVAQALLNAVKGN
ncbi:MAG TPA: type 1 glutamine amidotransferase domain-containing protein [Oligoflexus sp.]|uniref:type 1 glutamine amidotransferase domain-containing protein n=1 Tax=Oligoflexus sp. TaxID=1971216 RepID=UPI002D2C0F65|nr:type 1 glutamine amidotransferase domain-containing protein [Oligoflexus sp.]HYX37894.1 type 1 glutamine amidotransferase domain-containing protein [Oligoflexus sp.]